MDDIQMTKLLIILLFMFGEIPLRPNFITKYLSAFPLIKWIIFFLITIKKNHISHYLILLFLYIILQLFDSIYFDKKNSKSNFKNSKSNFKNSKSNFKNLKFKLK